MPSDENGIIAQTSKHADGLVGDVEHWELALERLMVGEMKVGVGGDANMSRIVWFCSATSVGEVDGCPEGA